VSHQSTILDEFRIEQLKYSQSVETAILSVDAIGEGTSQTENFIFHRHCDSIKIYDRVCDHNGGRLSLTGTVVRCPLHGWEFDPSAGKYLNVNCEKKPLATINLYELDSPLIELPSSGSRLSTVDFENRIKVQIEFINHACLHFTIGEKLSFATDPWIIGSAFCNGWWLAQSSPANVFEKLNDCDFIYISHNHPDHLHPESLKHIRSDMPMLTAGFETGSTANMLRECGFGNILTMNFVQRLVSDKHTLSLAVLKSGDFRDDSGLIIEAGQFKCLLTVDSNFLDFGRLPQVDLLCSSFAGGASGFPLCFENYSEDEKISIVSRNRNAIRAMNIKNIQITKARYFMPYAGFFSEKAERDQYIKERNVKNSVSDYSKICEAQGCKLLDVNDTQVFDFVGSELTAASPHSLKRYLDKPQSHYLSNVKRLSSAVLKKEVAAYFESAAFQMRLELDLVCTDDSFEKFFERFSIDFNSGKFEEIDSYYDSVALQRRATTMGNQYLRLKVRRDEFSDVILNGKPWEDLSIGFQCRIFRDPNVYESDFWYYFTNVYIGQVARRNNAIK